MTTPTTEEYLEVIYMMAAEGQVVRGVRLAVLLEVTQPTVSATLRRLVRDGLIEANRKTSVVLTERGLATARGLLRRHRIVERWLVDVLGYDWAASDAEAHRLEHTLPDEVIERLNVTLGRPLACPHGNPIPGNASEAAPDRVFPLNEARAESHVQVVRVSEYAEHVAEMLAVLEERGLHPGATVTVVDVDSLSRTLTLKVQDRHFALGSEVAGYVWVTDGEAASQGA